MKVKYSVIIPIYNAEKTLCRCVDSLLAEGYADAEIILVNDGSRDRSDEICREYSAKHGNVHYLEKENGGVSTARNAGLDLACGDYILFVDSDDYVVPGYFATIDRVSSEAPGDLIQFSGLQDDGRKQSGRPNKPLVAIGREALMPEIVDAMCTKTINGPWAKLYRRKLIETHHLRFPVGVSVAEDRVFNIIYSFYIQSYVVTDRFVYVVNTENEHSLTRGRHKNLKQQFEVADSFFQRSLESSAIPAKEQEIYQRAYDFGICRSVYHDAKLMHQDHVGWAERQKRLRQLCDKINSKHLKYPNTRYCNLITFPVRLRLTPLIDLIAWKLIH